MMTQTARAGLFANLAEAMGWIATSRTRERPPAEATDDDRQRRDLIMDRMEACPDAFISETDIQCMLHCFPGRF